jgi:predicted aconitase with swiveling domain
MSAIRAEVEIRGTAEGEILKLTKPISFWGGVDAKTGRICDPRHPEHDVSITAKILVLPGMVGSSSASYVLTELMMEKLGPAALVLPEPDAILPLAVIVAREMGWGSIPVVRLPLAEQAALETGARARIAEDGRIEVG